MSLAPVHLPQHIFTSTLTDEKGNPSHHENVSGVNIYIILLTAVLFFAVLGWFNFVLAFYGTITTNDPDHDDQTLSTLGFAILWTVIAAAIYYAMQYFNVLGGTPSSDEHPLLKGEGSGDGGYVGQFDIGI